MMEKNNPNLQDNAGSNNAGSNNTDNALVSIVRLFLRLVRLVQQIVSSRGKDKDKDKKQSSRKGGSDEVQ